MNGLTPPRNGATSSSSPLRTPVGNGGGDTQNFQDDIGKLLEDLEDARRRLRQETTRAVQRRSADVMENELKKCQGIVTNIDQMFREWTVYLAGEPLQRQKTRTFYFNLTMDNKVNYNSRN